MSRRHHDPRVTAVGQILRERIGSYYPELGSAATVVPTTTRFRPASTVLCFEIRAADAVRRVLVKEPLDLRGARGQTVDRPRVVPVPTPEDKAIHEHAALQAIAGHFQRLGDPAFGWIRVLDLLERPRAIVMERLGEPTLGRLLVRETLWRRPVDPRILEAAGRWLREYHGMPPLAFTGTRQETRERFVAQLDRICSFLGAMLDCRAEFASLLRRIERASSCLPEELPLGLMHGDYAPRNLFVGEGPRLTAIDTRGGWQAPIYEDVGYFLVSLRASKLRRFGGQRSLRLAGDRAHEQAFLSGYFADGPTPLQQVRLYELQSVLDKWSSTVHAHAQASGGRRLLRAGPQMLSRRFFAAYTERCIAAIESGC